jgi:hypothetical protein
MSQPSPPKKSRVRQIGFAVVVLAAVYVVFMRANPPKSETPEVSSAPTELHFQKSDYGEAWPFLTIESGKVYCTDKSVLFRDDRDGQIYGLNGTAKTTGRAHGYDWKSLDSEHIVGKDISFLLDAGNKLCQ